MVRMSRMQFDALATHDQALDRVAAVQQAHDDGTVLGLDGPVHHQDVAGLDPQALHGVALGPDEEGGQRVADEVRAEVKILAHVVFRGAREAAGGAVVQQGSRDAAEQRGRLAKQAMGKGIGFMHGGDCRGGRLHPVRPAHWADSLRPKLVFLLAAWRDYNGPMDDEFWKRHLEETERLARLADPLREFKSQSMRAQEQLAAMLRDPMDEFRDQIKAMTEPLSQVPAWLKDYNRHEEQLRALTQPLVDMNAQI